jgi:hypothetical protein
MSCSQYRTSDFQDVGYKANPWPSLYLDDDVQGIGDIGLDREVRYLDATLKDAGREPRKPQRGKLASDVHNKSI